MPTDVAAAAERWRKHMAVISPMSPYSVADELNRDAMYRDAVTLADAYLANPPAEVRRAVLSDVVKRLRAEADEWLVLSNKTYSQEAMFARVRLAHEFRDFADQLEKELT